MKAKIEGMKMKALVEATGVPKSAILHYVAQGLLPEPVRTGPNMAYYAPECVERLAFIKEIKRRYAFPLEKIRSLLQRKDRGEDLAPFLDLNRTIFGSAEGPLLSEAEFSSRTGLELSLVRELVAAGLLRPLKEGSFNDQDLEVGRGFAQSFALGIEVKDLLFYAEAARLIVENEMRLRQRATGHLADKDDADLTKKMVQGARMLRNYVIDRAFQQKVAGMLCLKEQEQHESVSRPARSGVSSPPPAAKKEDVMSTQSSETLPTSCLQVIQMMPSRLNNQAAAGMNAVFQFDITGAEQFSAQLKVQDGTCTFAEGKPEKADLTIISPAEVWLAIARKELSGESAYMSGKFQAQGDFALLMRFSGLFQVG